MNRHLHDTAGNIHTFAIGPHGIALNGRPCRLFIRDAHIDLLSLDPVVGVITVTPAALWHALAGDDPTAEDAGLIQAHALAGFVAMQEIAGLIGCVRPLLDEIDRHLHHFSQPPLPSYRFSPFVAQLLAMLDGTEEQTLAVARILKQPPQIVQEWGAQVGKNVSPPLDDQQSQLPPASEKQANEQPVACASTAESEEEAEPMDGRRRGKRGFPWTEEHQRLLEEAYDASQQVSTNARIKEIAAHFGWPFHVVDYRLRLLLGERKAAQRELVTQPNPLENQVEVRLPLTVSPEAGDVDQSGPVSLPLGPFLWDVKIDEQMRRWQLDIVYGQFPHQAAGTHFMYREQEYVLVRVWNSMIAVTRAIPAGEWVEEGSAALQMAAVSQRSRLLL